MVASLSTSQNCTPKKKKKKKNKKGKRKKTKKKKGKKKWCIAKLRKIQLWMIASLAT